MPSPALSSSHCSSACVYRNFLLGRVRAGKPPLLPCCLLPPAPTASSVADCRSPHPVRACLWWHPRGEIVTEICWWPARPSLTRLVFARVSCCFPSSQTHSCCSCISVLAASALPPPRPPPSACQPHLGAFADALPPRVFLTVLRCPVLAPPSSLWPRLATSSTQHAPSGPAPPRPLLPVGSFPRTLSSWRQALCQVDGSVAAQRAPWECSVKLRGLMRDQGSRGARGRSCVTLRFEALWWQQQRAEHVTVEGAQKSCPPVYCSEHGFVMVAERFSNNGGTMAWFLTFENCPWLFDFPLVFISCVMKVVLSLCSHFLKCPLAERFPSGPCSPVALVMTVLKYTRLSSFRGGGRAGSIWLAHPRSFLSLKRGLSSGFKLFLGFWAGLQGFSGELEFLS